ncbi:MAG: hypothetical protein RLZZ529_1666 [Bacteroidota bacterium]|jgi:hypothetical protein
MNNYAFFDTNNYDLSNKTSENFIYSNDLISLIKDSELKEFILNKYNLDENIKIAIEKIDIIFEQIKLYTNHFELIRLNVKENEAKTVLEFNNEKQSIDYYFIINEGVDEEGVIHENIKAAAIYDSLNLFYKSRSLSQYVKSLKKSERKKVLLEDLNSSWNNYFKNNPKEIKFKKFRLLKKEEQHYLKSINTDFYKEYGVAESFVFTVLELFKIKTNKPETKFIISSIHLSESEIDLIITLDKKIQLEKFGFIRPSISIRNEDKGNRSLGVCNTLEFISNNSKNKIYLYPKKDDDKIRYNKIINHTANKESLADLFSSISELFDDIDNFKNDFNFYNKTTNYDELRQKIAERILTKNSVFKDIKELKDLFSKEKTGHIENLVAFLNLCEKAELIDMGFDLKFKLRYLISDVLLYNKN